MNVKRFFGRNSREAMQKVRQAFGDNAVVLSTKPSSSGIEIVAMPAESIDAIERFESGPAAQADERFEDDLHEAEPMPDSFDAAPTDDPYRATGTKIGRYFEFKPVYVDRVATGKAVKVYVYGMATGQPVLIHAATHAPPFAGKQEGRGFTGFHAIYEPTKSSELQYWCEHLP